MEWRKGPHPGAFVLGWRTDFGVLPSSCAGSGAGQFLSGSRVVCRSHLAPTPPSKCRPGFWCLSACCWRSAFPAVAMSAASACWAGVPVLGARAQVSHLSVLLGC